MKNKCLIESPGYRELFESGELHNRMLILKKYYEKCSLCPHQCGANRTNGETGVCCSGSRPFVASYTSHYGEEPPISGVCGSGTIFFSRCSGRCIFCQNYPISQLGTGKEVTGEFLAEMMVELQKRGCHNINLVTPTHFIPSIVSAIFIAASKGLCIPIVYNTSGYERVEILRLLKGIIDIYLPDAKYADNSVAANISGFSNYTGYNRAALIEMYNQVGNLKMRDGIAVKGILVRHLILPNGLSGTDDVMKFLSESLSRDIYVSLMDQYFPAYKAIDHKQLSHRITLDEYHYAIKSYSHYGLHNGWIQEHLLI